MADDEALREIPPEPIRETRGRTRHAEIDEIGVTETSDPAGPMRHKGTDSAVHEKLVDQRSHAVSESEKTKRHRTWASVCILGLATALMGLGPPGGAKDLLVVLLVVAAGGFGIATLRAKGPGFEIEADTHPKSKESTSKS